MEKCISCKHSTGSHLRGPCVKCVNWSHYEQNCPTHKELQEAAMPMLELLNKYYCPHDRAIICEGLVEIVCGDIVAPLPVRD